MLNFTDFLLLSYMWVVFLSIRTVRALVCGFPGAAPLQQTLFWITPSYLNTITPVGNYTSKRFFDLLPPPWGPFSQTILPKIISPFLGCYPSYVGPRGWMGLNMKILHTGLTVTSDNSHYTSSGSVWVEHLYCVVWTTDYILEFWGIQGWCWSSVCFILNLLLMILGS